MTRHKKCASDLGLETWNETVQRMEQHIRQIEADSILLLREYCADTDRTVVNTNSTGKDSMVVTHLAAKAGLKFETYFNVTTLDVGESNRMARRNGYQFILPNPKYGGFYQYIYSFQNAGVMIPTRLNRFCCQYFKERPTIDYFENTDHLIFLFGMRNQESQTRSEYQDTIKNPFWRDKDWIGLLPIRSWTELDVWLYTLAEGIEINDKYRYGYSRVGCGIACPYYTKYTWVLDQYWYPKMYKRWRDILRKDFISQNKWLIMNCTVEEYIMKAWNGGVYRPEPTEEVVQEYAEYNGLDLDIARKYFGKYCANGCLNKRRQPLRIKDKDALAMNMKMFGRDINRFLCKKCLMKEFGWNLDQWSDRVADFKAQGCKLF